MAMLRRLHALGAKDSTGHLLRSLSSRSNSNAASSHPPASTDEITLGQTQRSSSLGVIGPASVSRRSFNSPNRGLSGLAGTGAWNGTDAISAGWGSGGVRSLTGGAEPTARRVESDEESTLSSLLDDLDAVRANAALELELDDIDTDTSIDIDMDETIDAPPVAAEKPMDFDAYGLNPRLQRQLRSVGVDKFFPVQAQCFEKVVGGQDLMCKSRTGSGKTLAFAIPIIEALDRQSQGEAVRSQRGGRGRLFSRGARGRLPRAICVAPTRELAKQIGEMRRGVDIIVGTPGRIIDHISQGNLNLSEIQFCVLDEADLMLQMGFQEPVEEIFKEMPDNKQTTLWSATMPRWVQQLSHKYLKSPAFIDLVGEDDVKIPSTIEHWSYATQRETRADILGLVASTKAEVDELCTHPALGRLGAEPLHGGLTQAAREACLGRFRSGRTKRKCRRPSPAPAPTLISALPHRAFAPFCVCGYVPGLMAKMIVATDVAARGLDIPGVDMVFHYRLPKDKESFVHRSGRTGRAGNSGVNIVLCSNVEDRQLAALEKDYSFKSLRRNPPSGASNVKEAANEMKDRILSVSSSSVRMYEPEAAELLTRLGLSVTAVEASAEEGTGRFVPWEGVQALGAAMSLLGGGAGVSGESYSMIDGSRGMQTLLVKASAITDTRSANNVLHFINDSEFRCPFPMKSRERSTHEGGLTTPSPQEEEEAVAAEVAGVGVAEAGMGEGGTRGEAEVGEEDTEVGGMEAEVGDMEAEVGDMEAEVGGMGAGAAKVVRGVAVEGTATEAEAAAAATTNHRSKRI
eukprot:jgi/Undpi1/10887/HiC_scaffold_3.g01413.m1